MEWTNLIPWGMTLVTVIIAIVTLSRNGRKDRKQEYVEGAAKIHEIENRLTAICTKLDQISDLIKETKQDMKDISGEMHDIDKRVTTIERDLKTAFNRIDATNKRIDHYHEGA